MNSTVSGNTATVGGGVYSTKFGPRGTVYLTNSSITNNVAQYLAGVGGGAAGVSIYGARLVQATGCTISGNSTAGSVGGLGIYGVPLNEVAITDCTIAKNTATNGAGIWVSGTTIASGAAQIRASTITGNVASGKGGGVYLYNYNSPSALLLDSTIVSGNHANGGGADIQSSTGAIVTTEYSAIGSTGGFTFTTGPGDLPFGADLKLQPLANNGGPTQTVAFAAGSPLLNAGDPALASTTDQRGVSRSIGGAPDIGAYEYQPIAVAGVQVNDGSDQRSEVRSISVTFSGPVSFVNGNAAAAFQLLHVQDGVNVANLQAAVATNAAGQTVVTLTFTTAGNAAAEVDPFSTTNGVGASLADGRYQLTVLGAAVFDAALGWTLDGDGDGVQGGNYVSPADTAGGNGLRLYRLFGDGNGDGAVNALDFGHFRLAYGSSSTDSAYLAFLDEDGSGAINAFDYGQFRLRYGVSIF
jgi:hypothetical protein